MRIMSLVRAICLLPLGLIYGIWMLFCFLIKLPFLIVAVWLVHHLLGKVGDFLLAMPVIYFVSCFLPNPRILDLRKLLSLKYKTYPHITHNQKAEVVEFKAYRRGVKP